MGDRPQRSDEASAYHHLYKDSRWRGVHGRRAQQLAAHPLCERCLKRDIINDGSRDLDGKWQGNPKRRYLVAHHKVPHRGDVKLFFGGELETLCPDHHDLIAQKEEHGQVVEEINPLTGLPVEG